MAQKGMVNKMKFNVKKLLASVMAVSMTAALVVVPAHAEDTAQTTLPGTHVADLYDGQYALWSYDAESINNFYSDIYAATGNTRINFTDSLTNYQDTRVAPFLSQAYLSDQNRTTERIKSYYGEGGAVSNNKMFTDESYMYIMDLNPYQSLAGAGNTAKTKQIPGNLILGMTANMRYNTSTKYGDTWYDFSDKVNGGYFTMEYSVKKNDAAAEESQEFYDNLYVICWDSNGDNPWWYVTDDPDGNTSAGGFIRGARNYVAIKLSDFENNFSFNNWSAVKIPMTAFSELQKDKYNYHIRTMQYSNGAVQQEDRAIDFAHFGGIGLVWIAPDDTSAYTAGSNYDKKFSAYVGKIAMEQVKAPTITKTETDGQVTISWDAVNADTSFNSKIYAEKPYTADQAAADTENTYRQSLRNASNYYKLIVDDTMTEKITYSVYKNGKEVQNSDALSYTDTLGSRNATYYVVAHGQKIYDQRRGWTSLEPAFKTKTLSLDSVKSNEVETGAVLDQAKNPKVFDLFVNDTLEWSYSSYAANTDKDKKTGTFNAKYNVTANPESFANYYLGDLGKYANVYGASYGYGNSPTVRSGDDKKITLRVQPSRFETNTLTTNLANNTGTKMFDDNMNGVQMDVKNVTDSKLFRCTSILDLSDKADTAALTFELRYRCDNAYAATNRENILNHLYVLVRDGKNSLNYVEIGNGGNIEKTANYMLIKLVDFIDASAITKDSWVTINVPLSAFASADSNYHQKMYTMSTNVSSPATVDPRPIDFKYFMGAGLVYVADGTETAEGQDAGVYNFDIDNMAIYNVSAPVAAAEYDAAANVTKVTWDMANEGYATYDLYKNNVLVAEDVENGEYTDTTPDVDAVYTVKANHVVNYAKANKYSTSTSVQKLTTGSDNAAIDYATIDFDAASDGVKAIGKFNPGATGVWIVVKFDKNYSVVGDVHAETVSAAENQQMKEYNAGVLGEGETVKSFLWNNLTDIIPKIDAEVYPAK